MNSRNANPSLLRSGRQAFQRCWRALVVADLAMKVLTALLLAPVVSGLFRLFLAYSGRQVLADDDILRFALSPFGALTMVLVGGVMISVWALEQAVLLSVLSGPCRSGEPNVRRALLHAGRKWPAITVITTRITVLVGLHLLPVLVGGLFVYRRLLGAYDINYYLTEKPAAWWQALAIGGVMLTACLTLLIPQLVDRILALPIVLFEECTGSEAIRRSRQRTRSLRWSIMRRLAAWGLGYVAVSSVSTHGIAWLGGWALEWAGHGLREATLVAGFVLAILAIVQTATMLLAHLTFAIFLLFSYEQTAKRAGAVPQSDPFAWDPDSRTAGFLRWNRWTVAAGSLAGLLLAAFLGLRLLTQAAEDRQVLVVAHRGASHDAPENTLAAMELAIQQGADWVELDVQESLDGVVVVSHDSDLMKVGGGPTKIWDGTAEHFAQVDIGSWFGPEFADQRVPTLAQVLELCKGRVRVTIELKFYGHDVQLEQRVVDLVESYGMTNDVVIMSLKQELLVKTKQLRPAWTVGLLVATALGDVARVPADFVAVNRSLATRRFIDEAHRRGKQVHVWTVNDPIMMSSMIGRGVDRIITDRPALAKAVIEQRRQMSVLERLLVEFAGLIGTTPQVPLTAGDA